MFARRWALLLAHPMIESKLQHGIVQDWKHALSPVSSQHVIISRYADKKRMDLLMESVHEHYQGLFRFRTSNGDFYLYSQFLDTREFVTSVDLTDAYFHLLIK